MPNRCAFSPIAMVQASSASSPTELSQLNGLPGYLRISSDVPKTGGNMDDNVTEAPSPPVSSMLSISSRRFTRHTLFCAARVGQLNFAYTRGSIAAAQSMPE